MASGTRKLVRLLVAISVIWVLVAAGYVFFEYLSRNPLDQHLSNLGPPEFYFWQWSGFDLSVPAATAVRSFEPNIPRIAALLIAPQILIWVGGYLVAWVASGFRSEE